MTTGSPTRPPYRELREAAGLTQRQLERELGWKTGHLSWIERGIDPTPERKQQLLAFLARRIVGDAGEPQ